MTYILQEYTEIPELNLEGSRLYSNRTAMLDALPIRTGGHALEIGVALGDFSRVIIDRMNPEVFYAADIFEMHQMESHWGTPSSVLFKGMTHEAFFRDRFSADPVTVLTGPSSQTLGQIADESLDLIYVDAEHTYAPVRADGETGLRKLRPGGIMIFNDYTLFDQYMGVAYGVVRAVNELINAHDLEVLGLALEINMFCDIAVRKR
jgi:hypothetical protein